MFQFLHTSLDLESSDMMDLKADGLLNDHQLQS